MVRKAKARELKADWALWDRKAIGVFSNRRVEWVEPNAGWSLVIIGKCSTLHLCNLMYLVIRMARLVASTQGQTASTPWGEYSWDGRRLWKNEAAATEQQKSCYATLDYHCDDTNLLTANALRNFFCRILASGFDKCLLLHRTLAMTWPAQWWLAEVRLFSKKGNVEPWQLAWTPGRVGWNGTQLGSYDWLETTFQ